MLKLSGRSKLGLLTSAGLALSACVAMPDLGPRPTMQNAAALETEQSFAGAEAAWPADRWWERYGDAQLGGLIEEALADAPSLVAAQARLRRAQAELQQTRSVAGPNISGDASLNYVGQEFRAENLAGFDDALTGDFATQTSTSLRLDDQLDFFGRNRARIAAASSAAEAAGAEAAAARLQLSTAIALAYADLARFFAARDAAEEIVRIRESSAEIVRQRFDAGLENNGQLAQAASEVARAHGRLVAIDAAIARKRNEIAALMGKGPDRGLRIGAPSARIFAAVGLPADVRANLIGRRPDLVAARWRVEAAGSRIDGARADFYPNVNLVAIAGLQTFGIDALGGGELNSASFGPAISLPIFSAGRLEGAYRGSRAEYDEAVALFNDALAQALRETADAVVNARALQTQLRHERAALVSAEEAYRVMRLRYEGGLEGYLDVLTVENGLVAQRRAVAELEAQAFAYDVALVRALGGGFGA